MIKVHSLSHSYGNFKAVDAVDFEIKKGEVVGLLGHNGAGKTTIMKMLTGYLEPTQGRICIDGQQIGADTRAIQARIGYLPENCPVWPEMAVIDFLEFQARLKGVPGESVRARVIDAIRRTALSEKATASIQTLSRGYRQRVGVAQALLNQPDIIILDEPTNGLDPTQIFQMRALIRDLAQSATVILSTHILQEVEAVCERVLVMRQAKLVVDATIAELQSGRQLRVVIDNPEAGSYLGALAGVSHVERVEVTDGRATFLLDATADVAPVVSARIIEAGDKLYRLHPETKNLETVFAEVNRGEAVTI